jgi:hypothetical protein
MIKDEIEPLIEELGRAEEDIKVIRAQGKETIHDLENKEDSIHRTMYEDLRKA